MKVHVVHDVQGYIRSAMVAGPDFADAVRVMPAAGEQVTVVDSPDVPDDRLAQHLHDMHQQFRVDVASGTPRLARR
jgi:hypothetical protein